jgi:hypothetical protein
VLDGLGGAPEAGFAIFELRQQRNVLPHGNWPTGRWPIESSPWLDRTAIFAKRITELTVSSGAIKGCLI